MRNKFFLFYGIFFLSILLLPLCLIFTNDPSPVKTPKKDDFIELPKQTTVPPPVKPAFQPKGEKRGTPSYDSIMGKDGWPHYRVFFWIPKNATKLTPYADPSIDTDVSEHGPVEKWSVVDTGEKKDSLKLVFVYVPKTFVYLYGEGFEKVIHLRYS